MSTPGDPNEPRQGQDPREGRHDEGEPAWWSEGMPPEEPTRGDEPSRGSEPAQGEEPHPGGEPIAPRPPVAPQPGAPEPDVPPTHEPRPADGPSHPDLPTSPETPPPATGGDTGPTTPTTPTTTPPAGGADAESTQVFPVPGATPSYPGWSGTPHEEEPPPRPAPSRYEQGPSGPSGPSQGPSGPPQGPPYGGQEGPSYQGGPPRDQDPTVPGTTPSSPYGGPPGYPPPPGSPYGAQPSPYGGYQQPPPGSGLATASLVLGVASPFLVFVCFTGLITAILSIVFGCVALVRQVGRGRAIAGIVISILSLILFAIVAIWFWNVVQECAHLDGQLADRCFESKFPWMNGSR
ncbi:hypothetical protein AB0C28_49220 [Nonomuraea sp. NPDC048892]|uniref:DUF4190 domain-containing protein n=1 Tax=Nonomuraea sp. NPDC048892 TaxID=3154624 RepID=UPI0033DE2511